MRFVIPFLALCLFSGHCYCTAPDQSTPQKAWESMETARVEGDDATFFRCMTPARQKEVLARMLLGCLYFAGRPLPTDADNPMTEPQKKLVQTLQEHGIDPAKMVAEFNVLAGHGTRERRVIHESEQNTFLLERFKGEPTEFYPKASKQLRDLQDAYVKAHEEEHRKRGDPVVERKKPIPDEFISAQEIGDQAVVFYKKMIDPNTVFEIGGQRILSQDAVARFRRIDGKWFLAAQKGEEQKIANIKIEHNQIPYKQPINLGRGTATFVELAGAEQGKNKIAFWGGGQYSFFGVGEKPFEEIPMKYVNAPNGGQTLVDDSYIRRSERIYTESRLERGQVFFVFPYKLVLTYESGQQPTLEIVEATKDELHGAK